MLFPNTYIIAWMAASLCVSYSSFRSLFVYLFIPSARPETITTMIQYSEGYSYSPPPPTRMLVALVFIVNYRFITYYPFFFLQSCSSQSFSLAFCTSDGP